MILFSPACTIYGLINWNKNLIPLIILIISILNFINLDPEELEVFVDSQESSDQLGSMTKPMTSKHFQAMG